jgi:hypothetical protein
MPDLSNLQDLTIIMPTHNRPKNISLQRSFWSNFPCTLLILNGSTETLTRDKNSVNEVIVAEKSLMKRLTIGAKLLKTKYCIWLGDDDFLCLEAVAKAISLLKNNPSVDAIYSSPREFDLKCIFRKKSHGEFAKRYSTLESSEVLRVQSYINTPIDRHFYAIQESRIFKQIIFALENTAADEEETKWYYVFPTLFEIGLTYLQRTLSDNKVWYLKGISGLSGGVVGESPKNGEKLSIDLRQYVETTKIKDFVERLEANAKKRDLLYELTVSGLRLKVSKDDESNCHATKNNLWKSLKNRTISLKESQNRSLLSSTPRLLIYHTGKLMFHSYHILKYPRLSWHLVLFPKDLRRIRNCLRKM